ncbi:MAG: arginyltransferase [Thioalkalivibrionaceae bacterium]
MEVHSPASIAWFMTAPQHCPYIDGRTMQTVLVDPSARLSAHGFGQLLAEGFRRSGRFVYRHQCEDCRACVPVRIAVDQFQPNRRLRRIAHRNHDLVLQLPQQIDIDEHVDLLTRYLAARHAGGGMDHTGQHEYRGMLESRHAQALPIELRLEGRLVAVGVTDRTPRGLSAMYSFFDPLLEKRSLGHYMILNQVELARTWHLPHVYLGYWIPECRKMAYKIGFPSVEKRGRDGRWHTV